MFTSKIKSNRKFKPLHAMLAAAILAVAVMPLAVAGADSGASASKVTDAKFKKLKQRIAALETKTVQAGGDLQGSYPDPEIRENAVGTNEVENGTLTIDDLGDNSVGAGEILASSVGTDELGGDVVGNSALKPVTARTSAGVGSNNTFVDATASCNAGEIAVAGGYAWTADTAVQMVASAPINSGTENNSWVARGKSPTQNTLFAWVNCLAL